MYHLGRVKVFCLFHEGRPKRVDLNLLKPNTDTSIQRTFKYTLSEASNGIPATKEPEKVTDLIIQVGLNNSQKGISAEKICDDTLEMQLKYKQQFKNARQHIVALPPIDDRQIEANRRLQKLANFTGSNFVSTKAFRDRMTGNLRKNLMDDFHYNSSLKRN